MNKYKEGKFTLLKGNDAYWSDFKIILTPGVNYWM